MLLSCLIESAALHDNAIQIINERAFDAFSRITTISHQKVCVFVSEERFARKIDDRVAMVITTKDIADRHSGYSCGFCICDNPKAVYYRLLDYYNRGADQERPEKTNIGDSCSISRSASISDVGVIIGNGVIIEEYAVIYPNTTIGDSCIIRAGAKIGVQDYNYYSDKGTLNHIYHAGKVTIRENAEIGYNTVVGKALYRNEETIIGEGCKIAHNCCIGHDVKMGNHTMIYSGSVIGGNTVIGDDVHITMNSTIKNAIRIGNKVTVGMGSTVMTNIKDGMTVFGSPATKVSL